MNDSRPFGAYAPSGLTRWVIERTRVMPGGWAGRRLAFMMRRLVTRSLKGLPLDMDTLGVRMRLYPYNNICEKRMAVEPQPDIFDRLTYNIRQNPFGTVKAVACAVADKAGELTLFVDPKNKGESSVKIVSASQTDAIRVPAVTLLDLLKGEGFTRVDAVKLDVGGAEDLILDPFFRDAPASLYPSLLIMEDVRGRWQTNLPDLLRSRGYRQILQTKMNLVFERA
jgi:FkbM family methyltransferase